MVGIADREVEPDHVVGERHRGVEGSRAGMVAELRVYPAYSGGPRLFDGHLGRALHDEVAHAIVAIQDGRAGVLVYDMDVGPDVEAAGFDPPDILRQPADAVPIRTLQVGGRHEGCDGCGVGVRQADRGERVLNEGLQPVKSN